MRKRVRYYGRLPRVLHPPPPDQKPKDDDDADKAAKWLIDQKTYTEKTTWFDDYGWWTIATGRAAEKTFFTESKQKQLGDIASDCWSKFTKHAPHVWERRAKDRFSDCAPAVPRGVWNGYWEGTNQEQWRGPVEGDPNSGTLLGIQNTVTNAVYPLSAQVRKDDEGVRCGVRVPN